MKLLLCAATELEIAPTIEAIKRLNLPVSVTVTGVGLLAALYNISKSLYQFQPDFLLQAGVAGCFNAEMPLGQTMLIRAESVGDSGVWEKDRFFSLFDMNLANPLAHPFSDGKLLNQISWLDQLHLPVGDGVTVNEITTNPRQINYYSQHLGAQMESLEGAALHYVGLMENIPFLQLRSASNYVGERNKHKWQLSNAVESLNVELQTIIAKILES